jgi:hypothetical protein
MKRKLISLTLSISLILTGLAGTLSCTRAQPSDKNREIVDKYLNERRKETPNEGIVRAALALLNTPYVAQTLEGNPTEKLVVDLQALDCMTFVENCLALSRAARSPKPSYKEFVSQLQSIRYRAGKLDGYTSRLHYTSDWIADNADMKIIEDVTFTLGGKPFRPQVNFMSTHPEQYPALQANPQDVKRIEKIEQKINQRTAYYLPKKDIRSRQSQIRDGDIIAFTTSLPGLDISHLGIAYRKQGRLHFIHASTRHKKVVVHPHSLTDYCNGISTNTGIIVLRAL